MLRESHQAWWKRIWTGAQVPAFVAIRPDDERRCPECGAGYAPRDRYCPRCHSTVPEWQFG